MPDFYWRTENEDDLPVKAGVEQVGRRKRPSWLFVLPILIILGLAAGGLYFSLTRQAEADPAEEAVTDLSSYLAERLDLVPPLLEVEAGGGQSVPVQSDFPNVGMTLHCSRLGADQISWNVFRYSLTTGSWNTVFQGVLPLDTVERPHYIKLLPGGDGYIIMETFQDERQMLRLLLWQDGQTFLVGEKEFPPRMELSPPLFARESDPTGRHLLVEVTSVELEYSWYLVDRQTCATATGCATRPVMNAPIWSPDGNQMLLEEPFSDDLPLAERRLYRADATGQNPIEIGQGTAPFWLNETTYGFGRLNDEGQTELVIANSNNDEAQVWVDSTDLMALVPADRSGEQLTIVKAWANPADPGMAALMTAPNNPQVSDSFEIGPFDLFLVQSDPAGEGGRQVEWLVSDFSGTDTSIDVFSPDGRFLFILYSSPLISEDLPYFRNLETGNQIPYNSSKGIYLGWLPYGNYYVQRTDGSITLTSPATGQKVELYYNFEYCRDPLWFELQEN